MNIVVLLQQIERERREDGIESSSLYTLACKEQKSKRDPLYIYPQ